jgi:hypothetical protein
MRRLDHVVVGVADLAVGIDWFQSACGVTPEFGGRHTDLGTHNALVALGPDTYLELLAPDPAAPKETAMAAALHALVEPIPVTWSARCEDAPATAAALNAAGLQAATSSHERRTPAGDVVRWDIVLLTHELGPIVPFLIEWGNGRTPAGTAPSGCALLELTVGHPNPDGVRQIFTELDLDQCVVPAEIGGLRLRLASPHGDVEIGRP